MRTQSQKMSARHSNTTGLVYDLEILPNIVLFCGRSQATGDTYWFQKLDDEVVEGDLEELRSLIKRSTIIGFNNSRYDDGILRAILNGASNDECYKLSVSRIEGGQRQKDVLNGDSCRYSVDLSNLLMGKDQKFPALKSIGSVLRYPVIGGLPVDVHKNVDPASVETLKEYCSHDVGITELLLKYNWSAYQARLAISKEFDVSDAMNLSDSAIGERVLLKKYRDITSESRDSLLAKTPLATKVLQFRYECPESIKDAAKDSPEIADLIANREAFDYQFVPERKVGGKVKFNTHLNDPDLVVTVGHRRLQLGNGGTHSIDKMGRDSQLISLVKPGKGEYLFELDVTSMYPEIMRAHGIAPSHADQEAFTKVLGGLIDSRIEAKSSGNKAKSDGLKISINSIYGKLQSRFSPFFDPKAQTAVVTTGQIAICLLTQWLSDAGAKVVTVNTDAVTVIAKSDVTDIVARWEKATGLQLERTDIKWYLLNDVSNRAFEKTDGSFKFKGSWLSSEKPGAMLKSAVAHKAVVDAVRVRNTRKGRLAHIEEFINASENMGDFLTSERTDKRHDRKLGDVPLQKNTRLYHSVEGEPISSTFEGRKSSVSEERYKAMPVLTGIPDDLDRKPYIKDARDLVNNIVPWTGDWNSTAIDLMDRGISPMPLSRQGLNFLGQTGQLRSIPKDINFSMAQTLGAYTGVYANNVICIDVDEPENVPQQVRDALGNSDGLFCWSTNRGDTPRTLSEVKQGILEGTRAGKAKVLFTATFKSNLLKSMRLKSHSGSYGKRRLYSGSIEVFFGEKVNILGESKRGETIRFYTLSDGSPTPLPAVVEAIVSEQFSKKALVEKVDEPAPVKSSEVSGPLQKKLLDFCVSRGMKNAHPHREGIRGQCFLHDHENPKDSDLFVGLHDDGNIWAKCIKTEDNNHHFDLNEAWSAFSGYADNSDNPNVLEFSSKLRTEEIEVRDLILSDEENLIIDGLPRTGKTGGAIASILSKSKTDGSLLVIVSKHKTDQNGIESRMFNAHIDPLDELCYLLNAENKLDRIPKNASTIITHWTYLNPMGHSGEQYGLLRYMKERSEGGRVVVVLDEFDKYFDETCIYEVSFDGRRMLNKGRKGATHTKRCPQHNRSGGCGNCELHKTSCFIEPAGEYHFGNTVNLKYWDNDLAYRKMDDAQRVSEDVWDQFDLGEELSHPAAKTQYTRVINQPIPSAPDVYDVGQAGEALKHSPDNVFVNFVRSLDDPTVVTYHPTLKETGEPVAPSDVASGVVDKADVAFPARGCDIRTVTGVYLGGMRALKAMGAKIRLMSATADSEMHLDFVERSIGESRMVKVLPDPENKQIDKVLVFSTTEEVDVLREDINGALCEIAHNGVMVLANRFREIDNRVSLNKQKYRNSPMWHKHKFQVVRTMDENYTPSHFQTMNHDLRVEFNFMSIKGGLARGANWDGVRMTFTPLKNTHPSILDARNPDIEQMIRNQMERAQNDVIQGSFRMMSRQTGEVEARRVLFVHSVAQEFCQGGKVNINFLEDKLNLISHDFRVHHINTDAMIGQALSWSREFLETGEFPNTEERDHTITERDRFFWGLIERLKVDDRSWRDVWRSLRLENKLKSLGFNNDQVEIFRIKAKGIHAEGGAPKLIEFISDHFQLRDAA